jgi:hypothetical protein
LRQSNPHQQDGGLLRTEEHRPRNDGETLAMNFSNFDKPPFGFVLVFLLFSLLFLSNTYKLWFKTDSYYQDIYSSLTRSTSLYPFKEFFLKRLENRKRWEVEQKIFSVIGFVAVIGADILVIMTFMSGK